jgi:hypothetical protein
VWYISLLLAAGTIYKKKSDKGLPVTLCLMFHRFLILCPIRSVSSLTNSCCSEWCRFLITLCTHVVVKVCMCGIQLLSLLVCLLLLCDISVVLYCIVFIIFFKLSIQEDNNPHKI